MTYINMTKEEVQQIIREEFANMLKIDRFVFDKNIQLLDTRNIQFGKTTGTKIGEADQKLSVYGATPVVQGAFIADPSGGGVGEVDSNARSAINSILDRLIAFGIIASS